MRRGTIWIVACALGAALGAGPARAEVAGLSDSGFEIKVESAMKGRPAVAP